MTETYYFPTEVEPLPLGGKFAGHYLKTSGGELREENGNLVLSKENFDRRGSEL